jgi:hypothetical protein
VTDHSAADDAEAIGDAEELRHDHFIGPVDLTRWGSRPGRVLARAVESASRNLGSHGALIMTLVVGGAIAVALSFLASRVYDAVTEAEGVAGLDMPILLAMMGLRSPLLDVIVTGYTNIAGPIGMPILAVVAILILSLRRRSWTPAILIAAAGIGSLLMTIAYLLLLRRSSTRGRVTTVVVATVFALTIGLSRVFLGHHWFTDVLAGWVLGAGWLALVITAHRLYITARTARAVRAAVVGQ